MIILRIRIVTKNLVKEFSITCSKIKVVPNNFRIKYKIKKICTAEFHLKVQTDTKNLEDHQQDLVEVSPLPVIWAQRISVSEKLSNDYFVIGLLVLLNS